MINRPSPAVVRAEIAALVAAVAAAILLARDGTWEPGLFVMLLAISIASDLLVIPVRGNVKLSGSFLAIVTAVVFLGETMGALIGVLTILTGWIVNRYPGHHLLINLVTYAWFPLAAGALFHASVDWFDVSSTEPTFYLLVFGLFVVALAIDFALIAGYTCYEEGSRFTTKIRRALVPLLPSELASAALAVGVAITYVEAGLGAIVLFSLVLGIFQYLLGALLVSQERAEELELRAKQLAGFQIALLGALLRTLDLRDRMTARHSAAVARYSRELAGRAGLSPEDQELAHTAGLLHDIGKFVLPDQVLKTNKPLTEADWEQIRRHPYEGARIVSQIDGYAPVGDIILAHHERIDGLGYPRGIADEEIPVIARIIAVVDTYDTITARDSYREPRSSFEAIAEMRRVSGSQLDARLVESFVEMLADKTLAYRHGEDADFETELAMDKRINDYVGAIGTHEPKDREETPAPTRLDS
jgi:putative nucleotidyltransferase with HDIG domain